MALFDTSKDLIEFLGLKLIFTKPDIFVYSKSLFRCHLSPEKLLQATEETPEKGRIQLAFSLGKGNPLLPYPIPPTALEQSCAFTSSSLPGT